MSIASELAPSHLSTDIHRHCAGGNKQSRIHSGTDAHVRRDAGPSVLPAPANLVAAPEAETPVLADPLLALLADNLDDIERLRIASAHRLGHLTRATADKDGEVRGLGLGADSPPVRQQQALVEALAGLEHQATLTLQRAMRAHPLAGWVKATVGVGEKQAARLLAAIGDPYWNHLHGRPRTVSELWAYCGLHVLPASQPGNATHAGRAGGEAARHRKGQPSNWSNTAKMRAYLIAVSCMKNRESPYRAVYELRRAHTATTHPDWSAGHSHNDGLRITAKAILRDLWIQARAEH